MNLGELLGHSQDTKTYEPWDGFLLPNCRIGLEFEFENVRVRLHEDPRQTSADWRSLWEYHEERSIRDNGAEYVFREPMFGLDAYQAMALLLTHARSAGWRSSRRTGIHVHLDARDMSLAQLNGLCILYAFYEPAIYRWVGDNRDSNVFCLPWFKAEGGINSASSVLRNAALDTPQSRGDNSGLWTASRLVERYAGMNLNSLHLHGSIEFRQLKTTLDTERVVDWINIIMALKLGAQLAPTCDGVLLSQLETRGARTMARELFGRAFDILNYDTIDDDCMLIGMPTALQLVSDGIEPIHWQTDTMPKGTNGGFRRFMEDASQGPLAPAPEVHFVPSELSRTSMTQGRATQTGQLNRRAMERAIEWAMQQDQIVPGPGIAPSGSEPLGADFLRITPDPNEG